MKLSFLSRSSGFVKHGLGALLVCIFLIFLFVTLAVSASPIIVLTDSNEYIGADTGGDLAIFLMLLLLFFILMGCTWLVARKLFLKNKQPSPCDSKKLEHMGDTHGSRSSLKPKRLERRLDFRSLETEAR